MHWIYLSPHLDDAIFSCGGLLWHQVQEGSRVEVWSIFAGDPPAGPLAPFAEELHARWGGQVSERRAEDEAACAVMSVQRRVLNYPDCIYRRLPDGSAVIRQNEDLFSNSNTLEEPLAEELRALLAAELPQDARLVCPLALGGHVDHRLTRSVAELLARPLLYYPDYPYAATNPDSLPSALAKLAPVYKQTISEQGLEAWQEAMACYTSQISSFWSSTAVMRQTLRTYWQQAGGSFLYG